MVSVTGATVVPVTVSPQPSAPAGHGTLALTVQGGALTSGFFTPRVHVDGYPVPVAFGTTPIPLVPGRHRVDVHTWWLLRYGEATIEVDVAPGGVVPVFYAVPWHQFSPGSIGHIPQQRKGGRAVAVYFGCILALVVAIVCGLGLMAIAIS